MSLYHLDTNYLISLAERFHTYHEKASSDLQEWLTAGHSIGVSAIAWDEFLTGNSVPRPPMEIEYTRWMLKAGVFRYGERQANKSAELFNQVGRSPNLKRDCAIAATAIIAKAQLATFNINDFKRFVPYGLRIVNFIPLGPYLDTQQKSVLLKRKSLL